MVEEDIFFKDLRTLLSIITEKEDNYPPINIYLDNDENLIFEFALAGWSKNEIEILVESSTLLVKGKKKNDISEAEKKYIFRKIAKRDFEVKYLISDRYDIKNPKEVIFAGGILRIKFKLKDPGKRLIYTIKID